MDSAPLVFNSRPSWDEYFLSIAKLAAIRSTCLALPVGAVVVRHNQILGTGYNGPPSQSVHCTEQGFCYPGLKICSDSKILPSRAIHAEVNAIAQAAKYGVSTNEATIYVTLEPCLSCLKLILAAGIKKVVYETSLLDSQENAYVKEMFINSNLIEVKK